MNINEDSLKLNRKRVGLSLQDTAYILNIDISKLSKCELDRVIPNLKIYIGYHLISEIPLVRLVNRHIMAVTDSFLKLVEERIQLVEDEPFSLKKETRINALKHVLTNAQNNQVNNYVQ